MQPKTGASATNVLAANSGLGNSFRHPKVYNWSAQEETTMSTAPKPAKMFKEFVVLETANTDELRQRLNDQSAQGLEFVQAMNHTNDNGFTLIFSRETPFKPTA